MKNLISISDTGTGELVGLLNLAKKFSAASQRGIPTAILQKKTVLNLFFENSTRTRMSFEVATRRLGGSTLNFAASTSSTSKGETLIDTALNLQAMNPHAIVVRHASAGSPVTLSRAVEIPIINAGDGFHEHPTQALLDAYTMIDRLGSIKNKRVLILGDIAHSRVARSNIHLLQKLGARVAVCGPPSLLPPRPEVLGVEYSYRPEVFLKSADVVMALRIQFERQNRMQIPSVAEYRSVWGLNSERASLLKRGALILHPGPVNRGVEIDPEVADGPNSLILDQVSNGVSVRMAVLAQITAKGEVQDWLKTHHKTLSKENLIHG
jgi:aspartate carbamoyltransferase catalytic subunit